MRRQKILVIVCAALFVIMLAGYFFVITPYIKANTPVAENTTPETEAGEIVGISDRIYIFEAIYSDRIKKITVDNEYGGFAFASDGKGGFVIDGHENVPYDEETFALLKNIAGNTLAKTKVMSGASDEKLEEYGLLKPQANWTIETTDGKYFKVHVGDALLTGGGYYCTFEGRPRSVYVLSEDIYQTILTPIEGYVTPVICAGIDQSDYYTVDKFTMYKNGEKLFRIKLVDKEDQLNPDALAENIMDYPTAYYPNAQLYYEVIYQFMGYTAEKCHDIYATAEDRAAVGLDDPAHVITFEYKDFRYELYFSAAQEDGSYYAESNLFPGVIGICSKEKMGWLENGLIDWVDSFVFQQYITNIAEIDIKSDEINASFDLTHGQAPDNGQTSPLYVKANGSEMTTEDVNNFRQYYKSLLAVVITDYCVDDEYCTLTEEELQAYISDEKNASLVFSYRTLSGDTSTIAFYPYSTRHSCVTIDGVGEFYVSSDYVKKIINDTKRVIAGETIDANGKY